MTRTKMEQRGVVVLGKAWMVALLALVVSGGADWGAQASEGGATLGEFAADAELFKKHIECMEYCNLEHATCESGNCMCEQPYCGSTCGRQCQHGGECSVSGTNNRCLCQPGWSGEFCEQQEPGTIITDDGQSKSASEGAGGPQADRFVQGRVFDGGRFPPPEEDDALCDISMSVAEIPFPQDLSLDRLLSVQVMCLDQVRNKVYFGVNSPSGGPVKYGSQELCKTGTVDLQAGTLVSPREMSTDFRYYIDGGKIVIEKFGVSPELQRCNLRAAITFM